MKLEMKYTASSLIGWIWFPHKKSPWIDIVWLLHIYQLWGECVGNKDLTVAGWGSWLLRGRGCGWGRAPPVACEALESTPPNGLAWPTSDGGPPSKGSLGHWKAFALFPVGPKNILDHSGLFRACLCWGGSDLFDGSACCTVHTDWHLCLPNSRHVLRKLPRIVILFCWRVRPACLPALGPGAIFTNSVDSRLDPRLDLDPDRVSLETRSGSKSSRIHKGKIIETRLSRDVSHDVNAISRRGLVCVTFFHSKSMATIVT